MEYFKIISKMYIIVNGRNKLEMYLQGLSDSLCSQLEGYNINTESYIRNALSLDSPDEVRSRIETYDPDVIFMIVQTEITSYYGSAIGGVLELGMYLPDSEKPVWKATLDTKSGVMGMRLSAAALSGKIINQLIKDKLIAKK